MPSPKETADIRLEIETEDSTLPSHSGRLIWYIPPDANGKAQGIAQAVSVAGTAVAGLFGSSVMQSPSISFLKGIWIYWAESTNPAGQRCVSPAFEIFVKAREEPERA